MDNTSKENLNEVFWEDPIDWSSDASKSTEKSEFSALRTYEQTKNETEAENKSIEFKEESVLDREGEEENKSIEFKEESVLDREGEEENKSIEFKEESVLDREGEEENKNTDFKEESVLDREGEEENKNTDFKEESVLDREGEEENKNETNNYEDVFINKYIRNLQPKETKNNFIEIQENDLVCKDSNFENKNIENKFKDFSVNIKEEESKLHENIFTTDESVINKEDSIEEEEQFKTKYSTTDESVINKEDSIEEEEQFTTKYSTTDESVINKEDSINDLNIYEKKENLSLFNYEPEDEINKDTSNEVEGNLESKNNLNKIEEKYVDYRGKEIEKREDLTYDKDIGGYIDSSGSIGCKYIDGNDICDLFTVDSNDWNPKDLLQQENSSDNNLGVETTESEDRNKGNKTEEDYMGIKDKEKNDENILETEIEEFKKREDIEFKEYKKTHENVDLKKNMTKKSPEDIQDENTSVFYKKDNIDVLLNPERIMITRDEQISNIYQPDDGISSKNTCEIFTDEINESEFLESKKSSDIFLEYSDEKIYLETEMEDTNKSFIDESYNNVTGKFDQGNVLNEQEFKDEVTGKVEKFKEELFLVEKTEDKVENDFPSHENKEKEISDYFTTSEDLNDKELIVEEEKEITEYFTTDYTIGKELNDKVFVEEAKETTEYKKTENTKNIFLDSFITTKEETKNLEFSKSSKNDTENIFDLPDDLWGDEEVTDLKFILKKVENISLETEQNQKKYTPQNISSSLSQNKEIISADTSNVFSKIPPQNISSSLSQNKEIISADTSNVFSKIPPQNINSSLSQNKEIISVDTSNVFSQPTKILTDMKNTKELHKKIPQPLKIDTFENKSLNNLTTTVLTDENKKIDFEKKKSFFEKPEVSKEKEQKYTSKTHEVVKPETVKSIHLPKQPNTLPPQESIHYSKTQKYTEKTHPTKQPNTLLPKPSSLFLKTKIITLIPLKSLTNTSIPIKNIPLFRLFIHPLKYTEIPTLHKIRDNRKEEFKQEKLECPHLSTVYDLLLVNDISYFQSPPFYDKSGFLKTLDNTFDTTLDNKEGDREEDKDTKTLLGKERSREDKLCATHTSSNNISNLSTTYSIINTFLSNKYTALQSSISTDTLLSLCLSLSNTKVRNNIIFKYLNGFLSIKNPYFFIVLAGILENENITKDQLFAFTPTDLLYENGQKYFIDVFNTKNVFFIHFFVQKVLQRNRITGIYILTVYTLISLDECSNGRLGDRPSHPFSLFPFLKYFCHNFHTLKFIFHLEITIKKYFKDINIFNQRYCHVYTDSSTSYIDFDTLKYLYLQVCVEGNRKDIGGLFYSECKNIFTGDKLVYLDNNYKEKGWMPFFGFRSVVDRSISRIVGIEEGSSGKVDSSGVDSSGVDSSGVDSSGVDSSGVDSTKVDSSGVDKELINIKEEENKKETKEFDFTKEEEIKEEIYLQEEDQIKEEDIQPSTSSFYTNKQYAQSFADFFTDEHTAEEVKTMDDSNITSKYFNLEDEPLDNIQSKTPSQAVNDSKGGFFSFFNVFNRKKVQKVKLTGQSDFKYDPVSKKWIFSGDVSGGVSGGDKNKMDSKISSKMDSRISSKMDSKISSSISSSMDNSMDSKMDNSMDSKEPLPPAIPPVLSSSVLKQSNNKKVNGRISSRYVISKGKPKNQE